MRVIYIAGAAHSGSTLLDLMLNAHPAIVSLGEVLKLNRQLAYRDAERKTYAPCSCGAPSLWDCKFWSAVDAETRASTGQSIADLDLLGGSRYNETDPNIVLFEAIAAVTGKSLIVDSSKLPRRLNQLMQLPQLDIYPVHLVRNPKGQIASVMRKHGGFLKNIIRYEIVQEQIRRKLSSVPHSVVRYEDLVRDPERGLNTVLEPLGLSFDQRQLRWAEAEKHIVAGNRMRYETKSELRLDEQWKQRLSARQQRLIDLGTLRSRRLLPPTGSVGGATR
jgi:hypothetical protein